MLTTFFELETREGFEATFYEPIFMPEFSRLIWKCHSYTSSFTQGCVFCFAKITSFQCKAFDRSLNPYPRADGTFPEIQSKDKDYAKGKKTFWMWTECPKCQCWNEYVVHLDKNNRPCLILPDMTRSHKNLQ